VAPDGKSVYLACWPNHEIIRVSRGSGPVEADVAHANGVLLDNLT